MQIAFLIIAHADPEQFSNLVTALDSEHATFFVHIDNKSDISEFSRGIQAVRSNVLFPNTRINVHWGGFSIVAATLLLLKEAVRHKKQFDRYILLSGVDYPIKSNRYIREFFIDNHKDYIDYFPLPGLCWSSANGGLDRFTQFHFNDFKILNPRNKNTRFISDAIRRVLKEFAKRYPRKMPNRWRAYGGHQFWALSHSSVMHILDCIQKNKKIIDFFKFTYGADEMFFQTILCNSNNAGNLENNHLRFVLWERESPAILDLQDWEKIKNSEALFARKFDSKRSIELMQQIGQGVDTPKKN